MGISFIYEPLWSDVTRSTYLVIKDFDIVEILNFIIVRFKYTKISKINFVITG